MGNQRNCSGRGKNKKSMSIPQVPSKEAGGEHQEAVTHTSTPRIPEASNNLTGKQNRSSGSEQGQASKVVTTPIQQEQPIAEDVLVSIVSRLRLRDAVRTSVLSRRWRHIWTRIPVFIFDGNAMFDANTLVTLFGESSLLTKKQKYELALQKTDQFITLVDSVLQQHQGDTVEELVVNFYLHKIHSHHLDEWLRCAVAAKTKKLRVYLGQPFAGYFEKESFFYSDVQLYDFPTHLLRTSFIVELSLAYCSLKLTNGFEVFDNIKELLLCGIDITEEGINHLLSNCSAVEHMTLQYNQQWKKLSFPCHLSQLRSLAIEDCHELKEIEINAINLNRIMYAGPLTNIIFNRSSQLEFADIRFLTTYATQSLGYYLTRLHRNLPDLRSLSFHIVGSSKVTDLQKGSCSFIHLKHLDWTWNIEMKMSLVHLATLLDVAPFLEELKLHLQLSKPVLEKTPQSLTKLSKMLPKQPHAHLKTVEISGFRCDKWQVEIALYLLSNATELESMTVKKDRSCSSEIQETDIKNLIEKVPANVEFVIV